jgi:malate dehydrogenase
VRCSGGEYAIEQGLPIDPFAQSKIDITVNELVGERDAVKGLGLLG